MKKEKKGEDSLKLSVGKFYENKFSPKKNYKILKIIIITIWCVSMFLLGYYSGLKI